jgi:lysophospholipase L1-like esterase
VVKSLRIVFVFFLLAFGCFIIFTIEEPFALPQAQASYPDPSRFEKDILAFESESRKVPPPEGAIVCIGSSSMRMWTSIHEDLKPLKIIHRGFGGSTMKDALYYADRIVVPYRPRAVLLYEGDNDAAFGISPNQIYETFDAFIKKIHQALPETRVYVLAIKPSISRWNIWDVMKKTNELLKARCDTNPLLTFIDVATPMLDQKGEPLAGIFLQDNLHMNEKGYDIWRKAVRPVLMQQEAEFEK